MIVLMESIPLVMSSCNSSPILDSVVDASRFAKAVILARVS
jgi:hypothetical protein